MWGSKDTWSKRALSCALSFCLATGTAFSGVVTAAAETQSPPAGSSTSAPHVSEDSSPTVVFEDRTLRTATSKHFLLSDGSYRAQVYEAPIHFKDGSGEWQDIDIDLEPGDSIGEWKTGAAPATARFRSQTPDSRPVRLEGEQWSVEFDMLGVAEGAKVVLGNKARYLGVAPSADLEYESLGDGLKETIILASPDAPNTFTFFMSLEGLTVCQTPLGDWMLVDSVGACVLNVGELAVFDSSTDEAGEPARCDDATMTVTSAPGGAYVTYTVSRQWMDAPGRVYPIRVDPTLASSASDDTYVRRLWQPG